ncbi:MAG TPA: hypothetical protein PLO53_06510, partial [Candidatus Hydrogenedentes bacterium]|nr:hypothetical protein [Candidatus Hydrogenedentota bacterium]
AALELIDGKEISEKTDYYALGITLIHLLNGRSPFYGMDVNTILGCHFRGRVPMPAGISGRFSQLLSGLLRVDPKTRWGYAQVTSWLRGEPVVEDAAPDSTAESAVKKVPYRSCPAITTPRELALNLDKFDAARDMRRGYISQWLMLFDEELGRKVAELEEAYYDNIEIGLFALKYLLIPGQPLVIGEHQVKSIGELAGLVEKYPNISGAKELEKAFQSGTLEVWIRCLPSKDNTPETLSAKIASIRDRNLKIDTALFALRFTLNPSASFSIGNTRITNLATLAAALSGPGASPQMIAHFIRSGKLLEWFRQKYPEKQPELRAIERIAREAENNPAYAVFCLRCLLNPETPLDVLGVQGVNRPEDFPKFLDKDPSRQQLGIRLLQEGWLRAWLVYTGRLKDPAPLDAILTDPTVSWARKLESVLWLLQPDLPRPVPMADVEELNGGRVGSDRWKPLRVTIFNGSRGTLCGTAWLDTESAGFIMASESFEGGPVTLTVYVSGAGLEPGSRHTARLVVNTNGGDLIIPVHFRVAGEWRSYVLRASGGGLVCGAAFGLLRYLLNPPGFTDASRLPPPPRADILADLLRDFPAERMIGAAFLLSMMLLSAILMVIHAWRVHKQQGNDMNSLADLFPGNHKPRSSVLDEEDDEKKLDHFNL